MERGFASKGEKIRSGEKKDMGYKDRKKNKFRKRHTRQAKRRKLAKKGLDLEKYYHGAFYIGHAHTVKEG